MDALIVWSGALCTIAIYSFLWQENKGFRVFQNIYVGLAAGYGLVMSWNVIERQVITPVTEKGSFIVIIPTILGLVLFTKLFANIQWMARWPMAFLTGIGAALSMKSIESDFVRQIQATLLPLNSVDNWFMVFGTVLALSYFFFTLKPGRATNTLSKVGRWVLMLTFGAGFGNAVQGRLSLLIARLQFMLGDWLHIIDI